MLTAPYKNAYEVAKEVHVHINDKGNYVLKNFRGNWCAIGLKQYKWPAYRHGKYMFFDSERHGKNVIFCGVHVEKGLSVLLPREQSLFMSEDWIWNEFIEDWQTGKVHEKLKALKKFADHSVVRINVSAGADTRKYDEFLFVQGEQPFKDIRANLVPIGYEYTTPEDTLRAILSKENEDLAFSWIDCYIGFYIEPNTEGSIDWIVNTKLDSFLKVFNFVLNRTYISKRSVNSNVIEPMYIVV